MSSGNPCCVSDFAPRPQKAETTIGIVSKLRSGIPPLRFKTIKPADVQFPPDHFIDA